MPVTPQEVLTDPKFQAMTPERRMAVLNRIDPDFSRLSPAQQMAIMNRTSARPAAASVDIPQVVAPANTDTPGGTPAIKAAQQTPATAKDQSGQVLVSREEGTGKPIMSHDKGATWQYMPMPPDPDAANKWLRENATGFLKQLANMPRAMWEQSFLGEIGNPRVRAMHEQQQAKEKAAMSQPGIMPGLSHTASLINPVVSSDGQVNYGATAANLLPYLLAARGLRNRGGATAEAGGSPQLGQLYESVKADIQGPLNAQQAAERITRALNPKGADIPGYQEQLAQHIDKVMSYIRNNKMQVRTPADLAQAIKGAGDEVHEYFYRSILGPVGETRVPIGGIPQYQGAAEGGSATLTSLDKRLSEINAELDPAYRKAAADSGRKLRTETDLRAEQGAIQDRYYRELSKATRVPEQQLRDMRQTFGSLQDLANKTRLRSGEIQHAAVAREQMPRYYIPFMRGHMGEPFFINEWLRQGLEKARGTPPERGIQSALGRVETPPYQVIPEARAIPRESSAGFSSPQEQAIRQAVEQRLHPPEGTTGTIETPSEGERAANRLRLAERGQKVRAEKAAKTARVGGARLARGPAGAPEGPAFGETQDISAAEREAHLQKLAERGKRVREARAERARKIAEARARRQRPPED